MFNGWFDVIIDLGVWLLSSQENDVLVGVIEKPVCAGVDDVMCGVFEMPFVPANNLDPSCFCDVLCRVDVPFGMCKESIWFAAGGLGSAVCVVALRSKFLEANIIIVMEYQTRNRTSLHWLALFQRSEKKCIMFVILSANCRKLFFREGQAL